MKKPGILDAEKAAIIRTTTYKERASKRQGWARIY